MIRQLRDAQGLSEVLVDMEARILPLFQSWDHVVVVGIQRRGAYLAQRLAAGLSRRLGRPLGRPLEVGTLDIALYRDDVSRRRGLPIVHPTRLPFSLDGRDILLVDDVLFTGRTVRAALNELMDYGRPRCIRFAVIVDRGCRELPIQSDVAGLALTTTRAQRVFVRIQDIDGREEITVEDVTPDPRDTPETEGGAS